MLKMIKTIQPKYNQDHLKKKYYEKKKKSERNKYQIIIATNFFSSSLSPSPLSYSLTLAIDPESRFIKNEKLSKSFRMSEAIEREREKRKSYKKQIHMIKPKGLKGKNN